MIISTPMSKISDRIDSLRNSLRHAFAIDHQGEGGRRELTEDERALIRKLANAIARRKMCVPAALFLESFQPLNYIGSQVMFFLRPFMTFIFSAAEYDKIAHILERRSSIEILIQEIRKAEEGTYGQT